jgi:hypothetical protein
LVFPARLLFMPVHALKRKGRLKPATTAQFFCDHLRVRCENPSTVLECAASSSLYDGASACIVVCGVGEKHASADARV